jgi:hypothetical protein
LEYLDVQQEKLLRAGLSFNIAFPGKIYQVINMVKLFLVDHARKEQRTCLN